MDTSKFKRVWKLKIGIISDLHLEFADWELEVDPTVDLYINAGDLHPNPTKRNNWLEEYRKLTNLFFIPGNHDFYSYDQEFPKVGKTQITSGMEGYKIVGATLWTDLSDPIDWILYNQFLADGRFIKSLTFDNYDVAYRNDKSFLLNSDADVIVSHHLPSYQSIHKKYANSRLNPCFASELYEYIIEMEHPPKLWIHGHTHEKFDYMIGQTRIICNPRGYPGEGNFKNYKPLILEI